MKNYFDYFERYFIKETPTRVLFKEIWGNPTDLDLHYWDKYRYTYEENSIAFMAYLDSEGVQYFYDFCNKK